MTSSPTEPQISSRLSTRPNESPQRSLNLAQQLFLRDLFCFEVLSTKQVKRSYQQAVCLAHAANNSPSDPPMQPSDVCMENLSKFVIEIDKNLRNFGFAIRKAVGELTNSQFYILINTDMNEKTNKILSYSEAQLEYFHMLLAHLIKPDTGYTIPLIDALNLTINSGLKFNKNEMDQFITTLSANKWLEIVNFIYY
ncbi:MAG: Non-structural maintenance of chromosomes element 1 [Marteilia pararefringens]